MADSAREQAFIFVTGASRSGTTMLSRVLGNAAAVLSLHELHFYGGLVPAADSDKPMGREEAARIVAMTLARVDRDLWVKEATDQEWMTARRLVDGLDDDEITPENLFACTMAEVLQAAEKPAERICEQTPRNIYYAPRLLAAYPRARIVHVVRDPRGVLASQKDRYKIRRLGGDKVPLSEVFRLWVNYHPFSMIKLWRSATQQAQALRKHERFHLVRYEDLIAKPEETLQNLCAELGITYDAAMTNVPHWGSSTVEHSASGGLSSAALDKWRTVLNGAEIHWCETRTRSERADFGYADSHVDKPKLPGYAGMALRLPVHVLGAIIANPARVLTILRAITGRKA